MDLFYNIIKGILIGLMVSIPLGPVGVIVIQRTLNKGWLSGYLSGMGAAFADVLFAVCAAFGVGIIIDFVKNHGSLLQVFAFLVIMVMGTSIFFNTTVYKLKQQRKKSKSYISDFLSVFFITLSNPLTIVAFIAFFAGVSSTDQTLSFISILTMLLGVFIGTAFWWFFLSSIVNIFRKKFRLRNIFWINKITGLVIAVLGIIGLIATLVSIYIDL